MSKITSVLDSYQAFTELCSRLDLPGAQVALIISKIGEDVSLAYGVSNNIDASSQDNAINSLVTEIKSISIKAEQISRDENVIELSNSLNFTNALQLNNSAQDSSKLTEQKPETKDEKDKEDEDKESVELSENGSTSRDGYKATEVQEQELHKNFIRIIVNRLISKDKKAETDGTDKTTGSRTVLDPARYDSPEAVDLQTSANSLDQEEEIEKFKAFTLAETQKRVLGENKSDREIGD